MMTGNGAGMKNQYTEEWYAGFQQRALESARYVVPRLLAMSNARSVLDVGCGQGAWLKAFVENGVEDIFGLDGKYVNVEHLLIDPVHFRAHNLNEAFNLDRKFDVAICLEVAEHLPTGNVGRLIDCICAHAPIVFFSAAIPGQGGLGHINEQWPSYWIDLFAERGYRVFDCVRPIVWQAPEVEYWYSQNAMLFVQARSELAPRLAKEPSLQGLPLVHPVVYHQALNAAARPSGRTIIRELIRRLRLMLGTQ
jgi:SAM-dependent methyltransferase